MNKSPNSALQDYTELVQRIREVKTLSQVGALLAWDQETQMPPQGAQTRAEHLALISKLAHEKLVSPEMGAYLTRLEENSSLDTRQKAVVRETRRAWDRETKLSSQFVEEMARTQSLAQTAWIEARKKSDFAAFAPWLEKLIALRRQAAKTIAPDAPLYDTLLDEYEPGAKEQDLIPLFESLKLRLKALVQELAQKPQTDKLHGPFPVLLQRDFGHRLAVAMGFDFSAGRLDISTHPFCTSFGPRDVRITTRYDENDFTGAIFGILHETGHALYEQGLPFEDIGTPLAEAASMAIHESQSRLWENLIGRSYSFWLSFFPEFQRLMSPALDHCTLDQFHRAINRVEPSLIRTESDEVTYNLHIALRFELERKLISGDLSVTDLPHAWNQGMQELLGVTPLSAAQGVLQDIHWSMGAFGYFPTYTLGNLYSAQFLEAAKTALPDLEQKIEKGDLLPLLKWLRKEIHTHGQLYTPHDLCKRVTGAALSADPFLRYLESKFRKIYS